MIYADRVEFKNPNVPHYHGRIDPGNFTSFAKNLTICKFMIQIGRYEELGSGVRKVNLYLPHCAPGSGKPVFEDGDMFKVAVPLAAAKTPEVVAPAGENVTAQVTGEVTGEVRRLLAACDGVLSRQKLQTRVGIHHDEHFRLAYVLPALNAGLVEMTVPDKPHSRLQKYRLTEKGRTVLQQGKTEARK